MIELRHLRKEFEDVTPLEDINVTIHSGAEVGCRPEDMEDKDKWGVAVVGEGIEIGYKAKVGPKAMVVKDVKDGEEQW